MRLLAGRSNPAASSHWQHFRRIFTITLLKHAFSRRVMHCSGTRELWEKQQRENTSGGIFPRLTMPLVVHFHYPVKVEHFHVINLTGIIK